MQPDSALAAGDPRMGHLKLASEEINILIYLYLLESNFSHTAFSLLSESSLPSTALFQRFNPSHPNPPSSSNRPSSSSNRVNGTVKVAIPPSEAFGNANGKIARGELVRKLWKALRWEEIEHHTSSGSEIPSGACRSPFHLLVPHLCSRDGQLLDETPSPPPKRPEAFPPASQSRSTDKISTSDAAAEQQQVATTEQDPPPPLAIGKGKRKVQTDSPPPPLGNADASATPHAGDTSRGTSSAESANPGSAPGPIDASANDGSSSDRASAAKRIREESSLPQRQSSRVPRESSSSKSKPTNNAETQLADNGVGSWSEHRDAVTCVAWNPKDKEVLVTASNDGTARLWDFVEPPSTSSHALQLGKKPASISHKSIDSGKKAVTALVWHPDGTVFATASDGVGRLFTPSGQLQAILTYGRGTINSLKFNPSGTSLLAAKDDFTVCLFVLDFELKSPKQLSFESHTKEVNDVDWLDDDIFASGGNDHTIFIYRANDRRPRFTLKGHTDDVTRVKWSPALAGVPTHQQLLASVSDDGNIMIWKLPQYPADRGTVSRSLSPSKQPREKEQSSDDFFQMTVSPGSEYCVSRLSVVTGGTENKRMNTLEWSPNCREDYMVVAAGGQDSTVKLFNALTGECLHVLTGLESGTGSIAFSPAGLGRPAGLIAAGGWNGKLVVWDVDTGHILQEHEVAEAPDRQTSRDRPMMMTMAWRNDGQQLALGLHNKSLLTLYVGALL